MFKIRHIVAAIFSLVCCQCLFSQRVALTVRYAQCPKPAAPDYSDEDNWAALPTRKDAADVAPKGYTDNQKNAEADVFFIHPTTYTFKPTDSFQWNGDVKNTALNKKTDGSTIRYQASIFNESCRIYAPRYRQAHYYSFLTPHLDDKKAALDLAYEDVKAAFAFYLKNHNQGRPIIIASHSQGTIHAHQLLRDFFESEPLKSQLVAAYLVGMPVQSTSLPSLMPCSDSAQTGCYVSWRSFERGHIPKWNPEGASTLVCQNPISWSLDTQYVSKLHQSGAVLRNFKRPLAHLCDAQVHNGYLWITKPKFPGSRFIHNPNYHIGDYNLFYLDVRKNVALRLKKYLKK